jgi:Ca-activated chloride channel homolog
MISKFQLQTATLILFGSLLALAANAQPAVRPPAPATYYIVPQRGVFAPDAPGVIEITGVDVGVVIVEQVATTTMDVALRNPTGRMVEAVLLVPVPPGAAVRSFSFEGAAAEPTATLLPKDEARDTYERIVAKMRDPALLEFARQNLIRSSVFPLPAGAAQKVRLTYEHVLDRDGDRVDYELPRSESLDFGVPWNIAVKVKSKTPISAVYSPSHAVDTLRAADGAVSVRTRPEAATVAGPFRLSYVLSADSVSASLLAYPDGAEAGYFLLLAGMPPRPATESDAASVTREITLVLDHSGSMQGEKIEQVRAAAKQVIAGLNDGEAFNLVVYNDTPRSFRPRAVLKDRDTEHAAREFLDALRAAGGTNIHDALLDALRPEPAIIPADAQPRTVLPLVLFLTDGLPTVGQTSEVAIRNVATENNPFNRRIFTFGVGADVNTPLLEKLASDTRAITTFVLPGEDVEVKVAQVFKGLRGPILTEPQLEIVRDDRAPATERVHDLLPARLPDLYEGDQLVLLGRYAGDEPLNFVLRGQYLGQNREFRFRFTLDQASTRNAFVPRLWAGRRIAFLIDEIRQMGADNTAIAAAVRSNHPDPRLSSSLVAHAAAPVDPRLDELTGEIIRLGTEFGILTEYTAFLAREGTNLAKRDAVLAEARSNFQGRAMASRSGLGSVNQSMNNMAQQAQRTLNGDNSFFDENMKRVAIATVQQINDRAFFRRGAGWVDSRVVADKELKPDRTIEFGSPEYRELARRLAADNRAGTIALRGDVYLQIDNELVLIRAAEKTP